MGEYRGNGDVAPASPEQYERWRAAIDTMTTIMQETGADEVDILHMIEAAGTASLMAFADRLGREGQAELRRMRDDV